MKILLIAALMSFVTAFVLGIALIQLFRKFQLSQPIKAEAPKGHQKKAGTPTLGGFIFILSTFLIFSITVDEFQDEALFLFLTLAVFCTAGFVDDTIKLSRKSNDGASSSLKIVMLVLASSFLVFFMQKNLPVQTTIIVPFLGKSLQLGKLYLPFVIFFYISMTNSMNLTDGLDGLASSIAMIVFIFLAIISHLSGHSCLSLYCVILAGSLLGFLTFNSYPASIIMGDTGSLVLGGAIASVAVLLRFELIVVIACGICVIESLSSLIQILWFRLTGNRIFKMAPIHHSFELSGFSESKITTMFSITTVVLCLLGLLSMV